MDRAYLNLALARVRRVVLEDLDGHDLVGALLPALDDLSEGAASEELEHLVLIAQRAEDLVLHQLVVAVGRGRALRRGGGRRRGAGGRRRRAVDGRRQVSGAGAGEASVRLLVRRRHRRRRRSAAAACNDLLPMANIVKEDVSHWR